MENFSITSIHYILILIIKFIDNLKFFRKLSTILILFKYSINFLRIFIKNLKFSTENLLKPEIFYIKFIKNLNFLKKIF